MKIDPADYTEAACRGEDTNLFYPRRTNQRDLVAGLVICNQCPIQVECAAENAFERHGTWGATERTRKKLRQLLRSGSFNSRDDVEVFLRAANGATIAVNGGSTSRDSVRRAGYTNHRTQPDEWVRALRERRLSGVALDVVAHEFNVSPSTAQRICFGELRPESGGPLLPPRTRAQHLRDRAAVQACVLDGLSDVDAITDRTGLDRWVATFALNLLAAEGVRVPTVSVAG